jgi:hypothetical protein
MKALAGPTSGGRAPAKSGAGESGGAWPGFGHHRSWKRPDRQRLSKNQCSLIDHRVAPARGGGRQRLGDVVDSASGGSYLAPMDGEGRPVTDGWVDRRQA